MRERVYIETSIPSFYHTLRADPESVARMHWTRRWWSTHADSSELLSSAAVIAELERGTSEKVQARLALLSDVELLEISNEIRELVRIYIRRLVMPNDPTGGCTPLGVGLVLPCRRAADVELPTPRQPE